MNTTTKIVAAVSVGLCLLSTNAVYSAPLTTGASLISANVVLGQTAQAAPAEDSKALLAAAKQAMKEKRFDVAEDYLQRAEKAQSRFKLNPFAESPKSVRGQLDKARQSKSLALPSTTKKPLIANPFNAFKAEPKTDPFGGADRNLDALLSDKKGQAMVQLKKGREALRSGNLPGAEYYAQKALEVGAKFAPNEDSPERLLGDIIQRDNPQDRFAGKPDAYADIDVDLAETQSSRGNFVKTPKTPAYNGPTAGTQPPNAGQPRPFNQSVAGQGQAIQPLSPVGKATSTRPIPAYPETSQVRPAGGVVNKGTANGGYGVARAGYNPLDDRTQNVAATATRPTYPQTKQPNFPVQPAANRGTSPSGDAALSLMQQAEQALQSRNTGRALDLYREASKQQGQLSPQDQQRLQEKLQFLAVRTAAVPRQPSKLLEDATNQQLGMQRMVAQDVAHLIRQASNTTQDNPTKALQQLQHARTTISQSRLSDKDKQLLSVRVDRAQAKLDKYVSDHKAEIDLDAHNAAVQGNIDRSRQHRDYVEKELPKLVEQFNTLRREKRFHEAEVVAKKARELAPDNQVTLLMFEDIRIQRAMDEEMEIRHEKQKGFASAMRDVSRSAIAGDPERPYTFGPDWEKLKDRRQGYGDRQRERHPQEVEIEKKLSTPISAKFREMPLNKVVEQLKQMTSVNIHLDGNGLSQEGVHESTPVTLDLIHEISLKSALDLILQPLHLDYIIENEVLKITSEQFHDHNTYSQIYNVADLVIPLPNFESHHNMGLTKALEVGYRSTQGTLGGGFAPPAFAAATPPMTAGGGSNPDFINAQGGSSGYSSGGSGGASNAEFEPLIELITTTIEPQTWDEVGGPGRIHEFETNLSLVVSTTQDVHDKIRDLLEQLRRLQDLQVTIEVRFITLDDDFFERIGVDFDFNIDNRSPNNVTNGNFDNNPTQTLGFSGFSGDIPVFTRDLDVEVRQGSFSGLLPSGFAGFDPTTSVGTSLGFAILSDIEAFFLIEAAQSDSRSNLMQAPKVTLFNGQAASISNQVQKPFVTSVIPVVGDFAAAQAPVIVVLSEGTTLSVQAVVSADRRFVRLTLVPFFSEVKDVSTFTFEGSTTSTASSSDDNDVPNDTTSSATAAATTTTGTTIQLPEFGFTTVTTTVSVPDGGTVLLGGIKQLTERRTEHGTPILSKLPYINRLFKNVGIGRETQSLMLMVTPRIIIHEEEEEYLTN